MGVRAASGRGRTMPVPALPGHVCAATRELADGSALNAATICAAVDDTAPDPLVARPTTMSQAAGPVTDVLMLRGEFGAPGSRNSRRTLATAWRLTATRVLSS